MNEFLIIGNDARMKALAEMLTTQFATVKLVSEPNAQDIKGAKYIILPPKYSNFDIIKHNAQRESIIFGEVPDDIDVTSFNYLEDEEFAQRNAVPIAFLNCGKI